MYFLNISFLVVLFLCNCLIYLRVNHDYTKKRQQHPYLGLYAGWSALDNGYRSIQYSPFHYVSQLCRGKKWQATS